MSAYYDLKLLLGSGHNPARPIFRRGLRNTSDNDVNEVFEFGIRQTTNSLLRT